MDGCTLGGPVCCVGSLTGGSSLPFRRSSSSLESSYPINQIGVAMIIVCIISNKEYAKLWINQKYGWGDKQFACLETLWFKESNWNHKATNSSSGAYGIPQSLPGRKMATFGDDWKTNPATQIKWGANYIEDRYDTPCGALDFFHVRNWY